MRMSVSGHCYGNSMGDSGLYYHDLIECQTRLRESLSDPKLSKSYLVTIRRREIAHTRYVCKLFYFIEQRSYRRIIIARSMHDHT